MKKHLCLLSLIAGMMMLAASTVIEDQNQQFGHLFLMEVWDRSGVTQDEIIDPSGFHKQSIRRR